MAKLKQKHSRFLESVNFRTIDETMEKLISLWNPTLGEEVISINNAIDRISYKEVYSKNTLPVNRSAKMDGVAINYEQFINNISNLSVLKENIDYAPADMGDDFDDIFDSVIPIESFSFDKDNNISEVSLSSPLEKGQCINQRGASLYEGEVILEKGELITPFKLGLLASAGISEISVIKKPKIAYIPTGDELIYIGEKLQRGKNIETNSLMISEYLKKWNCDMLKYPIIKDNKKLLEDAFLGALKTSDIVILNGGTSMGTEDYNSTMIEKNSSFYQHGVRCIPGIPIAISIIDNKPIINLPGPPFAAFCGMDWCIKKLVSTWYNTEDNSFTFKVKLNNSIKKPTTHQMYVRLEISKDNNGNYQATPLTGNLRYAEISKKWNGIFLAPVGKDLWQEGDLIEAKFI